MNVKRLTEEERLEILIKNIGKKRCKECLEYKVKSEFAKNGTSLRSVCKKCTNIKRRANYKAKKNN